MSVTTAPQSEEAVVEMVQRVLGKAASTYLDVTKGRLQVTAFLEARPERPGKIRAVLLAGLESIRKCGLNIDPGRLSLRPVRPENWAESWKRHFRPIEVGRELLIKPPWSRRRHRKGQAVVVLDPGLSFGTGHHPTTGFCLRQLVALRKAGTRQSFLDIGTGSGILAIAAAKLGYRPVEGFDVDAKAVAIAKVNARANGVGRQIRFTRQDLNRASRMSQRQFSVVCANLIAPLLVAERQRILARLHPRGALVLAGILRTEFPQVRKAYAQAELTLIASRTEKEWHSGTWHRRSSE